MPDRTLNYGDPADAATRYRTRDDDPAGGGNFVVVEDLDGNLIPLQYNPTSGALETAVPIDTGDNDITTTGTVSTGTLEAGGVDIGRSWQSVKNSRTLNTTETNNTDGEIKATVILESDADATQIGVQWLGDVEDSDYTLDTFDTSEKTTIKTTIPAGATYEVSSFGDTANFSLFDWMEMRP